MDTRRLKDVHDELKRGRGAFGQCHLCIVQDRRETAYIDWMVVKEALAKYRGLKHKYQGAKYLIYILAAAVIVLIADGVGLL